MPSRLNRIVNMAQAHPRYSKEEFARRGDQIYARQVQPTLPSGTKGKFVAIDIESGAFEIDADEQKASDRLAARVPGAQIWLRRVDMPYVRRFGGHTPATPQ